ncbi:MAG TPA: hypothetical protein DHW02_10810 [Ktedonobacter sp.]|nr:hypothetical protein [Ktedonobacter sp.]
MSDYMNLYDYRQYVGMMYRTRNSAIMVNEDAEMVWQRFRQSRDELFATHPQSALDAEQRRSFTTLPYFPYNPTMRFVVDVVPYEQPVQQTITMSAAETMTMLTIGHVDFAVDGEQVSLSLYWLDIYGGGLFLPFRDATCPKESYGGGRYLFDTIKGSDFVTLPDEHGRRRMLLDFNYAYNPSCAYNDAWTCPLAPVENRLKVAIRAGEMKYR